MKATPLESKGLKKKFRITVEAGKINSQTEAELKRAGERVKIPGFRPGFIPMKVLKQRYGKSVQSDVLKQVINRASNDAISENKLRPAMTPQISIEDYKEGGDLAFTMELEVFPEVPEVSFDKVKLDRPTFDIGDKDIDEAVQRIAERSQKLTPLDGGKKAAMGHVVAIDFTGSIDGTPFPGGAGSGFQLELGSGQFIEGFEEQLVGSKAGDERSVKVTFPADYHAKDLAGKEAVFAVSVKEVLSKEMPELDEAFAKERGFADMRALREAVRNQLIREYDQVVRNRLKKQLFDALDEAHDFTLPEGMMKTEFDSIWGRLTQAPEELKEALEEKSEDELKEEYRQIARRRVKLGILLAEIGGRNKIQVSREELGRAVMQQASQFPGQEKQVVEFYQKHPERADDLRGPILEEKVVDFILGKISYDDRKVSLESLMEDGEEEGAVKKKAAKEKPAKPKARKKASGE